MVLGSYFASEFATRIARRIDLTSEACFGFPKCRSQFRETHIADDQQVDIAEGMFIAAGDGAVNKGAVHTRLKRRQHLLERWHDADRFLDQAAQLRE